MQAMNVGFIGFGFIGKVHAYGYMNLPLFYDPVPLKARITHICTSHQETAEKGRAQVGADVATTDWRAVAENPKVDIVHICTPNHLHKEELLASMAQNKHIYCDKPLVANMREAIQVEQALDAYTGVAQMTFQNRFFPATIRAGELIRDGFLGELLEFRASYLHSGSADPAAPLKWKLSASAGGGVIADLATHVLDLVHALLGDYKALSAATHIAYPERPSLQDPGKLVPVDAEDCVMILARMKRGGIGFISATKTATGTEDELRFEIHGSRGALRFNSMAPHYLDVFDGAAPKTPSGGMQGWTRIHTGQRYAQPAAAFPSPKNSIGWLRCHMACLANFLDSVADNSPGNPGLEQGLYIQQVIERVRDSAASGQWVTV